MRGEGLLFETEDGRSRFLVRIGMPPVVVGRRPSYAPPNVRVSSVLVSRQHLRVLNGPNGYAIEDAGSTGGIYLEGERLRGVTPVGAGSRIQLGGDTVYVARTFFGESLASMRGLGESGPADLPSTLRMERRQRLEDE